MFVVMICAQDGKSAAQFEEGLEGLLSQRASECTNNFQDG